MDAKSMLDTLSSRFPEAIYDTKVESGIRICAKVDPVNVVEVCRYLKDELSFGHLSCEFAIDYLDRNEMEVVYLISSYEHPVLITLKAIIPRDNPEIESVVSVFWNANWYERETYELFGIQYINHPNLKPLVLTDEMLGEWPFRKDYKGYPGKTAKNLV